MAEVYTDRLRLRPWTVDDIDDLAGIFADPAVWWYPFRRGLDREAAERFLAREMRRWDERGFGRWAAETTDGGTLIGFVGLGVPDWLPQVLPAVDIGWRLSPDHWGRGLATEAARAAVRHGFDVLGVDRLLCMHDPANLASARVADKLGFRVDHETVGPDRGETVVVRARHRAAVRPATGADLEPLVATLGSRDYFEDRLARQSGGLGTLFVAVTAGPVGSASEVVGTVHLAFGSAWEPEWRALLPDVPSLNGLGVAENSRRLGIATALVAAAERQARRRGLPRLLVGVEPGNHAALALYERLGWRVRPDRPPPGWRPGVHVLVKALQAGEEGRTFGLARRRAAP